MSTIFASVIASGPCNLVFCLEYLMGVSFIRMLEIVIRLFTLP